MQLDHTLFVDESMREPVDLQRLYVEIIESFVDEVNGAEDIHLGLSVSLTARQTDETRTRVREVGYEGLIGRRWIDVIGMDVQEHPRYLDALDPYEALINEFGRHLSLQDPTNLRASFLRWKELNPNIEPQAFAYLLAETAVNQTMDRRRIGRIEMRALENSSVSLDLANDSAAIVEIVRERIENILA